MKKILLGCLCVMLVGCASVKEDVVIGQKPAISEEEYVKQQEKYEFDLCTSLVGGTISRCENREAICYIATGYNEDMSISCFKKDL